MSSEANLQSQPSGLLKLVGGLFLFLITVFVVIICVRLNGPVDEVDHARAADRISKREATQREDKDRLTKVGWVDKSKEVVHIPIDEAKNLLVAEFKAKPKPPVVSSVQVPPTLPPPAPYDPKAKEPAPAAFPSAPSGADTIRFDSAPPAPSAPDKKAEPSA